MTLIFNKTLLRLGVHILSTGYLKNKALCFTELFDHNNVSFNQKIVADEDSKEGSKEVVIV